jgi:FdhD protein
VRDTPIAGEHPLTLYVDKHELVTLMTLGAAPEALAIGYLRNQRLLDRIEDIVAVQVDWDVGAVVVKTRHGSGPRREDAEANDDERLRPGHGVRRSDGRHRQRAAADGCDAVAVDALRAARPRPLHETIYKQAGAVHGCALATNERGRSRS